MNYKYTFKTAVGGIITNKGRSILTVLGIVIGITAIILVMSIGQGAENLILNEINSMGVETIVIRPGREPEGFTDIGNTLFADSLNSRDIIALKKKSNVPGLEDIAPAVIVPGGVSYLGENFGKAMIFGWTGDMMGKMYNVYPDQGRYFDSSEIAQNASVAVIGSKVKKELFGESDAIGEFVKVKDKKFRVIGVLPSKGQVTLFNMDEVVLLPYTTAQKYLLGINHFHEVFVRTKGAEWVDRTVKDIEDTLRETHNITDTTKDDFFIVTQEGMIDQVGNIIGVLTAFLALVVAVSLVVGGIGVMNIMLVSVTERTHEIGLRKAIGATKKDILVQFLMEAIILTGLGGFIGIALGAGLSYVTAIVLTNVVNLAWNFIFPISAVMLGMGVSAFVGLVFGIYPANQASKKSPIEALRYE